MQEVANKIVVDIKAHLKSRSRTSPVHTNRASELGHPCVRYLAYVRIAWEHRDPPSETLQVIFDDGNLHETYVTRLLQDAGYDVRETQRPFGWKEFNITGHLDAVIWIEGVGLIPVETKSTNDYTYNSINSWEDLKNSRQWWVRKWAGQIQLYLLLRETEYGLMVLKDKAPSGVFPIKVIPVALDYPYAEVILKRAEIVNEVVEKWDKGKGFGESDEILEGYLPDRIEPDESICGMCSFLHRCKGVREFGPELILLSDERMLELAREREEAEEAYRTYQRVDKLLKQSIKNTGDNILIGDEFHATVKESVDGKKLVKIVRV